MGLVEDATAVGDGLGLAVSRLEQSEKEKDGQRKGAFIILLTDGSNNSGVLAPRQASELAKKKGDSSLYHWGRSARELYRCP